MSTYRYKILGISNTTLQKLIENGASVNAISPIGFVDINITDDSMKPDLDILLGSEGFEYNLANPTSPPVMFLTSPSGATFALNVSETGNVFTVTPSGATGVASIITGKTIFVDSSNNNSTDNRQNLSKYDFSRPFVTIQAAISVAVSGDDIIVFPNTYTEVFPIVVPSGVNLIGYDENNVRLQPTVGTNTNNAIILNASCTVAKFKVIGTSGCAFYCSVASNNDTIPNVMQCNTLNCGKTLCTSGSSSVKLNASGITSYNDSVVSDTYGVHVDGGSSISIHDISIYNRNYGVRVTGGSTATIDTSSVEGCTLAVSSDGTGSTSFIYNMFYKNNTSNVETFNNGVVNGSGIDQDGRYLFGNSINTERINSTPQGTPRAFSFIDTNGVVRVWRYTGSTGMHPSIEFIWGTDNTAWGTNNKWWDVFLRDDDRLIFRRRTTNSDQPWFSIGATGLVHFRDQSNSNDIKLRFQNESGERLLSVPTMNGDRSVVLDNNSRLNTTSYQLRADGYYRQATGVDITEITESKVLTQAILRREISGSDGVSEVDILRNGVSVFTPSTRPKVGATFGDQYRGVFTLNSPTFSSGDRIEMSIITKESGNPQDLSITIKGQ